MGVVTRQVHPTVFPKSSLLELQMTRSSKSLPTARLCTYHLRNHAAAAAAAVGVAAAVVAAPAAAAAAEAAAAAPRSSAAVAPAGRPGVKAQQL